MSSGNRKSSGKVDDDMMIYIDHSLSSYVSFYFQPIWETNKLPTQTHPFTTSSLPLHSITNQEYLGVNRLLGFVSGDGDSG